MCFHSFFFASKKQRRDFMSGGLLRVISGVITPIMVLSMGNWGDISPYLQW